MSCLMLPQVDDRPHLPDLYGAGFAVGYLFPGVGLSGSTILFYFRQHRAGAVHCGRCGQEHSLGISFWVAIIMGSITGAAGGVIRDVFINEIPLIFRKEIYAMACVVGGIALLALRCGGT